MPFPENVAGIDALWGTRTSGEDEAFAVAYEDGVERLAGSVAMAIEGECGWVPRLYTGLLAGLEFLAADPSLARLLLVEALASTPAARLEHERSLTRLARALRRPPAELAGRSTPSEEMPRLLAAGLVSHLSGLVLAGEGERLADSHGLLLQYLLAPSLAAARDGTGELRVARA